MIQKLTIKNFQSHSSFDLEFDPHITTIVGASDVGKSAIIRALRWAIQNKPGGEGFIKDGTDHTEVVVLSDGHEIVRHRGKQNTYAMDGQVYKSFGTTVPPNIQTTLRMGDINFQQQQDGVFWFSESAGEVSRQLNQIVDLGIIDSTLAYLGSKIRENNSRLQVHKEILAKAQEDRSRLKPILEIDHEFSLIEQLGRDIEKDRLEASGLRSLIAEGLRTQERHESLSGSVLAAQEVIDKGNDWIENCQKAMLLGDLLKHVKEADQLASVVVPDIAPLSQIGGELRECIGSATVVRYLVEQIQTATNEATHYANLAGTLQNELTSRIGTTCPLCLQPVK